LLQIDLKSCTLCGACAKYCPLNALSIKDGAINVSEECSLCGMCVDICPEGAISIHKNAGNVDQKEWSGILVFIQTGSRGIHPITFELMAKALELAAKAGEPVYGVAVGSGCKKKLKEFSGISLKSIYCYDDPWYRCFRDDIYADAVCDCIEKVRPAIVLLGATPEGRTLAPRCAVRQKTGLTADCTGLYINEHNNMVQIRPAYGGKPVCPDPDGKNAAPVCNRAPKRDENG